MVCTFVAIYTTYLTCVPPINENGMSLYWLYDPAMTVVVCFWHYMWPG